MRYSTLGYEGPYHSGMLDTSTVILLGELDDPSALPMRTDLGNVTSS